MYYPTLKTTNRLQMVLNLDDKNQINENNFGHNK